MPVHVEEVGFRTERQEQMTVLEFNFYIPQACKAADFSCV
jgi:septum formation topological specificity factor MinE